MMGLGSALVLVFSVSAFSNQENCNKVSSYTFEVAFHTFTITRVEALRQLRHCAPIRFPCAILLPSAHVVLKLAESIF